MKILPLVPKKKKKEESHFMTVHTEPEWYVWTCPVCGRQVRDSRKDERWQVDRPGNLKVRHELQCVMPIQTDFQFSE